MFNKTVLYNRVWPKESRIRPKQLEGKKDAMSQKLQRLCSGKKKKKKKSARLSIAVHIGFCGATTVRKRDPESGRRGDAASFSRFLRRVHPGVNPHVWWAPSVEEQQETPTGRHRRKTAD